MKDKIKKWKGKIHILNKTKNKLVIFDNVVCDTFYIMVADFMAGSSPNKMTYISFGDDATTVDTTDTVMGNELYRKAITTTGTSGSQIILSIEVNGGEALFTWKELGVFNAASSGSMTNHANVDYTHNAGDVVTITWYIEPTS